MIVAREMMRKSPPSLSFDATVPEAIEYFQNHNTNFVTVRATADRMQGVLTEATLMRIFLRYQAKPDRETLILYRDLFEPAQLVLETEVFPEVVKKVGTAVGHRIFVINPAGDVVGFITAKDVLTFLSRSSSPSASVGGDEVRSHLYLYENFFEKSPFMMHSVNEKGVIQMANETLHAALDFEYGELIGKTIFDLYPKEAHEQASKGIQQIFDHGFHKVVRGHMVRKDQSLLAVELVSRVLTDQNKKPIGTITVSRPQDMDVLLKSLQAY